MTTQSFGGNTPQTPIESKFSAKTTAVRARRDRNLRTRTIRLRVGARGQESDGRLRDSEDYDEVAPYPVTPIAEVGLAFEMVREACRIIGGDEGYHSGLDEGPLPS